MQKNPTTKQQSYDPQRESSRSSYIGKGKQNLDFEILRSAYFIIFWKKNITNTPVIWLITNDRIRNTYLELED